MASTLFLPEATHRLAYIRKPTWDAIQIIKECLARGEDVHAKASITPVIGDDLAARDVEGSCTRRNTTINGAQICGVLVAQIEGMRELDWLLICYTCRFVNRIQGAFLLTIS